MKKYGIYSGDAELSEQVFDKEQYWYVALLNHALLLINRSEPVTAITYTCLRAKYCVDT